MFRDYHGPFWCILDSWRECICHFLMVLLGLRMVSPPQCVSEVPWLCLYQYIVCTVQILCFSTTLAMASTYSNTSRCSSFASVEAANSVSYGFSVFLFATSEPSPSDAEGSGGGRQPLKCQKAAGSRIEGSAHFSYHNCTTTSLLLGTPDARRQTPVGH